MGFDPYGERRKDDWLRNLDAAETEDLAEELNSPMDEVLEHELSHVKDMLDGIGNNEGQMEFLEAAPFPRPMLPIPGEGRAINRTNTYRHDKSRGYYRTKIKGPSSPPDSK